MSLLSILIISYPLHFTAKNVFSRILYFQYVNERCGPLAPKGGTKSFKPSPFGGRGAIVENIGVEPMTSCVQGRRSSQLS